MAVYELIVIIDEKSTPAKKKAAVSMVEKLVEDTSKGKILKSEDWGIIDLAYKISGKTAGVYLFFELELDGKSVSGINTKLNIEKSIIRAQIIKK